jgi:Tol biopolymer transport system component
MYETSTRKIPLRKTAAVLAALLIGAGALVGQSVRPAEAAFPGKNGKIVFTSDRTTGVGVSNLGGDREIFSMNPDGTGLKQLTHNSYPDVDPVLAPGAITVAYTSYKDGDGEIYTMDINGGSSKKLTDNSALDGQPSFSPVLPGGAGIDIAFMSGRDGNHEIYRMNLNGTGQARLTDDAESDEEPAWSPDGTKIAFQTQRDNWEIYTMDPDGSDQTNTTKSDHFSQDKEPTWSPDGTKIAFASNRDANNWEIYRMDSADGAQQTRLTDHPALDREPAYSPNGRYIAFASGRDGGDWEIFSMNAEGLSPENRTNYHPSDGILSGQDTQPDWGRRMVLRHL